MVHRKKYIYFNKNFQYNMSVATLSFKRIVHFFASFLPLTYPGLFKCAL